MTTKTFDFEITNQCTCDNEDVCYGDCWYLAMDQWLCDLDEWFIPGTYRVDNWPTWRGGISGWFDAKNVHDFLIAIVPDRTDWNLRYATPKSDMPFEAILYHHDAPTGGLISVYLDNNNEREYGNE